MESIYEYSAKNIKGIDVPMQKYAGKVLLIVNTASRCGLAAQLRGLEQLYQEFQPAGLEILGFPSADFAGQELEQNDKIQEACQINYGVSFQMFAKTHVRGKDIHPIFAHLTQRSKNGIWSLPVFWNFQKYIVNRSGKLVNFYFPFTKPQSRRLRKTLIRCLAEQ